MTRPPGCDIGTVFWAPIMLVGSRTGAPVIRT
jgi:hypothetical protein